MQSAKANEEKNLVREENRADCF